MIRPPWRRRPHQPGLTAHDGRTAPRAAATHYATLGITRDARARDIVRAYRRLAKRLHPDVNVDLADAAHFKRASAAYAVLSDPARRAAYDASLDAVAAAAAPARRRAVLGASRSETSIIVALATLACVGLLYIVAFAFGYRDDGRADATPTDAPEITAEAGVPSPSAAPAAGGPSAAASAAPSPTPARTTSVPVPFTPAPTASASPQPPTTSPTSIPSATSTLTPTPSPTPPPATPPPATQPPGTPAPTATPARCVVPSVIGMRRNSVQATWLAAGFGTLVQFLPGAGNYLVATQNLAAGTTDPCATTTLTVGP